MFICDLNFQTECKNTGKYILYNIILYVIMVDSHEPWTEYKNKMFSINFFEIYIEYIQWQ